MAEQSARDAAALEVTRWFAHEDDYPDFDAAGACERLGEAIRFNTVNSDPATADWHEFDRLHAWMRERFPHVMAAGTFEVIARGSVLITLPGTDDGLRPALFMAHQDVVPVVAGTEDDWSEPPFSGTVDDDFIWGRGTMDIKEMVAAELDAAEYVLARGGALRRTLYLAFGEDEESFNTGSDALAQTLQQRGVTLEYVWDEGGCTVGDGARFGAPDTPFLALELSEKGYVDLALSVQSDGGHSSNPYGGTSLGTLAQAIARIVEHPFPVHLPKLIAASFRALAPAITEEPFRSLVAKAASTGWADTEALAQACMERPELFPLVTTTIAPTMIEGSSQQPNVMPQDMRAVVNFRLAPGTSVEDVVSHCRSVMGELPVTLEVIQGNDASAEGRYDGYGFTMLSSVLGRYFVDPATGEGLQCVPSISRGATDAHNYERICDTCMRFSPFLVTEDEEARGIHGTDERLPRRSYIQGIRAVIRMIEQTCC